MLVCCFRCCRGKQNQTRVEPALDDVEDGVIMTTNHMRNAVPPPVGGGNGGQQLGSNTSLQRVAAPSSLIHAAAVNGEKQTLQKLLAAHPGDKNKGDQFGRSPLMFAVLADRLDCAEVLIKIGAKVNVEDNGGRTALHWAAYKGNFRMCKLLLAKGANWKKKDHEGQKALHLATRHPNTKCMSLIMKQLEPGEVDEQDKANRTALHWSASYGNEEAVVMLMRHNSNIGIPDTDGKTPLHWAASSGDTPSAVKTVQIILDKEPSVINWQDYEGRTALHLAVAHGHSTVVQQLINFQTPLEKCNISVLDNAFRTPLHWAAVLGHTHIVNLLLDHKANFTSSDSNGATPLHYAAQNNHAETVESFLARENITDEPDMEGRTSLMWAAGKGAEKVIRSIVKHNPDINATDKTGATALHAAAMSGHTSCVLVLMELGSNVNILDASKHTPLFRAAEMGHTDVAKVLIEGGAEVDIIDQEGRSPLHWAALGGNTCICTILINHEINPNIQDFAGRTPLQCAAYGGFINAMSLLIEKGADTNIQDQQGMTALHMACTSGGLDAAKLLLEHGAFPNHMEYTEDHFTPLDYALLNDHHEVSQYMIEQGALSITSIRDIAAIRIQTYFRGYRVRKTFLDRKMLLMKHEQLRKDAAKKKEDSSMTDDESESGAVETLEVMDIEARETVNQECDMERDIVTDEDGNENPITVGNDDNPSNSNESPAIYLPSAGNVLEEGENNYDTEYHEQPRSYHSSLPDHNAVNGNVNNNNNVKDVWQHSSFDKPTDHVDVNDKRCANLDIYDNDDRTIRDLQKRHVAERRRIIKLERKRLAQMRQKNDAAIVIQRNWRNFKVRNIGIVKALVRYHNRLPEDTSTWERQIAACTIQLAWRRYYRRKLLKILGPNKRYLHSWQPEFVALKQHVLLHAIYNQKPLVTEWHPTPPKRYPRPNYLQYIPSPAALSYNFAVDQYVTSSRNDSDRHLGKRSITPRSSRPISATSRSIPDGARQHETKVTFQEPKSASLYSYNHYH
ncbi:uncharacterized protein [Amphiura filiformis]|uniref:uncharacterized protein n=1 Tax=Amphiura filiformis TaxID=82378 RepID=UPI003B21BB8F